MAYVNKVQKDDIVKDIHDSRIPETTSEDQGKTLVVDSQGNISKSDAIKNISYNSQTGETSISGTVNLANVKIEGEEMASITQDSGAGSVAQKIVIAGNDISGEATGAGAVVFGGKRIDKVNQETGAEDGTLTPTVASGDMSFAQGGSNTASGLFSVVFNKGNTASGRSSAVLGGEGSTASGQNSFVTGEINVASGRGASACGTHNTADGNFSHVEGYYNATTATAVETHVEGGYNGYNGQGVQNNAITASLSHVEGTQQVSVAGTVQHVEGTGNTVSGQFNHVEGGTQTVSGEYSHVEGANNTVTSNLSHTEGQANINEGSLAHAEGTLNHVFGSGAHVEGGHNKAWGLFSHSEGLETEAGRNTVPFDRAAIDAVEPTPSDPEPSGTKYVLKDVLDSIASFGFTGGSISFQIKDNNGPYDGVTFHYFVGDSNAGTINFQVASTWGGGTAVRVYQNGAWVDSKFKTIYVDPENTTEAFNTWLEANKKPSEPVVTTYPGSNHAEGHNTKATAKQSHAEGANTVANGTASHAEGYLTEANGAFSHAGGKYTTANGYAQTVVGKYNNPSAAGTYDSLFQVGNGTSSSSLSNAFEVFADGTAKIGAMGSDNLSVATKKYVDDHSGSGLYKHTIALDSSAYIEIISTKSESYASTWKKLYDDNRADFDTFYDALSIIYYDVTNSKRRKVIGTYTLATNGRVYFGIKYTTLYSASTVPTAIENLDVLEIFSGTAWLAMTDVVTPL